MLGEIHSLHNDFPEMSHVINHLTANDSYFFSTSKEYHQLDKKIRALELNNIPTSDHQFLYMKKQRVALKDELYSLLKMNATL